MARKPRLHYPGAVYHVTLRGNAKRDVFLSDNGCRKFCALLEEGVERFSHRIHAFCLMPNHIHLAIQVDRVPLSDIVQNFSFRYTQWFNWSRNRVGHLFQGRYKAMVVDAESYLLQLVRYIHLNPVRAGLAKEPALYRWSSHKAYLGDEELGWVTTDWVLSHLAPDLDAARREYRKLIQEGLKNEKSADYELLRRGGVDSRVIGDDDFTERVMHRTHWEVSGTTTLSMILNVVSGLYGIDVASLAAPGKGHLESEARSVATLLAKDSPGISLTQLSKRFGRDISTLSANAARLLARSRQDEALAHRVLNARQRLREKQKSKPAHAGAVPHPGHWV